VYSIWQCSIAVAFLPEGRRSLLCYAYTVSLRLRKAGTPLDFPCRREDHPVVYGIGLISPIPWYGGDPDGSALITGQSTRPELTSDVVQLSSATKVRNSVLRSIFISAYLPIILSNPIQVMSLYGQLILRQPLYPSTRRLSRKD
jgi:hypothetical protein